MLMTFEEFSRLGMAIKEFYPSDKVLQTEESVKLWFQQLKDLDYKFASVALSKYVATHKWSPTIADIRENYMDVTQGEAVDWGEGWKEVLHAIRRYGYMREPEALESMTETTREVVERLGWWNLCMSENISVERANFRQIYTELADKKREFGKLPASVQNLISSTVERMAIEDRDGKDT